MFLCKIVVCCKSHKHGCLKQCRKELSLITAGEEGYYEIKIEDKRGNNKNTCIENE